MSSQLDRIKDWKDRARLVNYHLVALAKACGVSLRQLECVFLDNFGIPLEVWVNELRLRDAKALLFREVRPFIA